ncbi:hypothetical protein PPERSA_10421 [Pseudocohnilembus persalinus]|uniref:Uncharacterized protein n=1 Tax=Pseudocohnilembus persalinus TaxID=266149 RepID=A0A0V0QVW2_PSEPJ|nr:hypothetical protein PPERSA_10421 [Pseudocohnilembus persalinus]|eukprot:KRX06563.1 hypothetical protein PPERSA_10421 [Pseudocohnilembus persalinus]
MHFQIQTLKNPSNQEITQKIQNTNLKQEILHFFNSGILKKISIQLKQQHLKQQFLSQKNENFIILIFLLILKYNYPSFFQKEILFNNQDKQKIDDLLSKTYIEIFSKIPTNSKEIVINHVIFANIKLVENDENNYSNGEEIDEELKQIQTEEEIKENLRQKFFQFTHLVIFKILGIFVSNPYIKENCNRIFNQIDKELEYKKEYEKKRIQKEEFKLIPLLPFLPKKVINHPLKTSEDPENFYILLKKFLEEKQIEQTKPYEKKITEQQKKQEEEKKLIKNDIFKYYNVQADHQERKLLTEMKENQFQNKYFREMVEFQIVLDKTRQKFKKNQEEKNQKQEKSNLNNEQQNQDENKSQNAIKNTDNLVLKFVEKFMPNQENNQKNDNNNNMNTNHNDNLKNK